MMRRNNRGNMNDIDMELAMIKRRRQMIQEQRQMLEERDQLELLQGQAGNWQQNMRYNNIQQPFNQFNDVNAFNQYPSVYDNNSNGYQRSDDYQSKVWQHNAAPKPQMYGNSGFDNRDYQMNGPQQLMTPGNDGRSRFNRNANRLPGPQRQQPRFTNATKPIGVKGKTQFVQGRVMKPKVVANPLNKSKFPKKVGPGYAGPVWEGHIGVRGPRQVTPMVHDNTYLVTRKTPNPKLHGRLELCLGEILREVKVNVEKSGLDIKMTVPLVKTIKEYIRNRIRKTMVGKHAHTVSYVLNLYRNRHPSTKDVMFVKNLKDTLQKEATAKVGVDTVSSPASKSLTKDSVKQKPVGTADKTGDTAEWNPPDEEEKEFLFQKMYTQNVTSAQLNKLLLKLNDLVKAEAKEEEQGEENADESQTEDEEKKTEGEGEEVTGEEGEGMEVEKKEGEESATPKDEKMDRLERLIEQKLPFILPRFKNLILAILNNEPIPKHYTNPPKSKLFMVKLLGKPTLPKRLLLSHFLVPYNVLNIKKLKSRGNVLIIGCGTEQDRDRLLAASGSTIENIKLHITTSPDTRPTPNQTNGDAATTKGDAATTKDDTATTKGDAATTKGEEGKDVTVTEEAGNDQNDTVDLCDDNGDVENGTEQEMEDDEDQSGQAESEVIDLDAQDDVGKAEPVVANTVKVNPGQDIKKEAVDTPVVGTPSKSITTRRSSRFPK